MANAYTPHHRVKCMDRWVGGGQGNPGNITCKLAEYAKLAGLTETEIARQLGFRAVSYISDIFRGVIIPPGVTMLKLAALIAAHLPDIDLTIGDIWLLNDKKLVGKLKLRARLTAQINRLDNDIHHDLNDNHDKK